jgi:6-phosphogluconate dehydrogenase
MATERPMRIGMVGLGRMGSGLVARLTRDGHEVVATDLDPEAVARAAEVGARGVATTEELVEELVPPRVVWLMVPAGAATEEALARLAPLLVAGDLVVDGGNTFHADDQRRAAALAGRGIGYVDVGVSGGVWGRDRGFCLMVGGSELDVRRIEPLLRTLAPGLDAAPRTPGRSGAPAPEEHGFLHCGPVGAGHFVKMVHNGIEYALMTAYAEGLSILRHAALGREDGVDRDDTVGPEYPERYGYRFDLSAIAELWRRGSVVSGWLLDLTAAALLADPELAGYAERVVDSGEGRWTVIAAIEEGVPADVIAAALFARFASRGRGAYAARILSAMRHGFGGHPSVAG